MAIDTLSLPVDIPWKRLCVSKDMIDRKVCDREFPYRWRSSVAVFSYEPPEEHQNYEGLIVSYLKIACTITGFQPDPDEVGLKNRKISSHWSAPEVIENYKDVVSQYYGCYGAILEVAIAPPPPEPGTKPPLWQYPYFADFQPKKREVYEIVSETGEVMSRSLENVKVQKGTTTTSSHEMLDIFGGFSQSAEALSIGISGQIQGQWGTRDIGQEEYTNMRTTDQAREMRESFSHTTQLTQMYHQFSSYHLGTNRAVFFMLPRPHIIESPKTFVNGPRLLEGIQEIFLVVMRPEKAPKFCVEAYLETAHIASTSIYEHETSVGTLSIKLDKQAKEVDLPGTAEDSQDQPYEKTETYTPPDGWEVDLEKNGGYKIESKSGYGIHEGKVTEVAKDHVTAWVRVVAQYINEFWDDIFINAGIEMTITVYIRKKTPNVTGFNQTLWLTGRGVCCCPLQFQLVEDTPKFAVPSVVWEGDFAKTRKPIGPIGGGTRMSVAEANEVTAEIERQRSPIGGDTRMSVAEANEVTAEIGRQLYRCINHPDRYPFGKVQFLDTQFLANSIANLLTRDHPDNHRVTDIKGLDAGLRDKVVQVAPIVSRRRLLQMSLAELADRLELSDKEASKLRRATLGLEGPEPDPKLRWDPPRSEQTVPNVVGLPLEHARRAIREANLLVSDVTYQDNELPHDTVLNQYPNAGDTALSKSGIDLVVASGVIVRIPEVIGKSLTQALCMLRDAGLESEPEIIFAQSEERPKNHILEVTPEVQSYVTPHVNVVLQVSSGS